MPLKFMYMTNSPEVAHIAQNNGAEHIFVDMEFIGKGRAKAAWAR